MKFSTISIAAACAFTTVTNAAVLPVARDDAHIGDFRIYGESGCSADNLGVWTVLESDVNNTANGQVCHSLSGDDAWSVSLTDIIGGCWLYVYRDEACSEAKATVGTGGCVDSSDALPWGSWSVSCNEGTG